MLPTCAEWLRKDDQIPQHQACCIKHGAADTMSSNYGPFWSQITKQQNKREGAKGI